MMMVVKHAIIITLVALSLAGCKDESKIICGTPYEPYGILNQDDNKSPEIKYKMSVSSVVLGVMLFETVFAPIYFFGFDLYVPVNAVAACPNPQVTK